MAWREIKDRAAKRATRHASKDAPREQRAAGAILDFDDPEIGVAFDLTGDIGVGGLLIDGLGAGGAKPSEFAFEGAGLGEDGDTVLELVELDQDGAGIGIAAPRHHHRDRLLRR
jgi:hypothetical protein